MKYKIKLQKDFFIFSLLIILGIFLYFQYIYSKKNLIKTFESEKFAKTIEIRNSFNSLLNKVELIFKTKLDDNLKKLNSLYFLYNGIDRFNAKKIAEILNKDN